MNRSLIVLCLMLWFPMQLLGETLNIVGDDDFPPYSFKNQNQEITGIDVDLLNEMASRMNITVNIDLVPWKRLLLMTKNGDVSGSFSLFKTPERESYSLFTHPLHYSTYKLFTNKINPVKYDSLKDLYGKRIGKSAGFVISSEFDEASARGDISVVEIYNFDATIKRLLKGGIDAFAGNELVIKYKLQNTSNDVINVSNIIALPQALTTSRGGFFVLSKAYPLGDKLTWQARITETLAEMERDGTYDRVIQKYIH